MSAINYTYYVTIGALETQVYPSGDWSLKIAKAEEDFPYCKDYRIKFDGEFIFSGDDYNTLLLTEDCCDKIDLKIQCNGVDYWFGYFAYPYDFEVDEDRCQISGTPKPLDKYYWFDMYADYKREELGRGNQVTWQRNFPSAPAAASWEADVSNCVPCEAIVDIIDNRFLNTPLVPGGFTLDLKSAFFNDSDDGFPSGPYTPGAGNNYVTECPNKLKHVVMAMATDIYNVAGGAPWSPGAEMSFNDFMEIVHNTFNTWWYIDENGDFRIEHIYFWELYFPVSYNLTSTGVNPIDGGRWIVNTSKYNYRVEETPKEEQWNWSTEWMDTFIEEKFTYYDCFLPGKTRYIKEYSLSDLTTDIEYIAQGAVGSNLEISPPDSPPDSIYMFLRCILDTDVAGEGAYPAVPACADYVVWFSQYLEDVTDHLNAHLSPTNLLANYWIHDRPLWTGYMTELGTAVAFESTWKNLRQTEFCFPVCCEECYVILEGTEGVDDPEFLYQFGIDFNEFITTQYGDGELYTGTIKDGTLCLQLIFEDKDCEGTATEWSDACEL